MSKLERKAFLMIARALHLYFLQQGATLTANAIHIAIDMIGEDINA